MPKVAERVQRKLFEKQKVGYFFPTVIVSPEKGF